jgi:hypothetical protein
MYGERLFDKAAATLWNILHGQLRNEQSLSCFKKNVKTHSAQEANGEKRELELYAGVS